MQQYDNQDKHAQIWWSKFLPKVMMDNGKSAEPMKRAGRGLQTEGAAVRIPPRTGAYKRNQAPKKHSELIALVLSHNRPLDLQTLGPWKEAYQKIRRGGGGKILPHKER